MHLFKSSVYPHFYPILTIYTGKKFIFLQYQMKRFVVILSFLLCTAFFASAQSRSSKIEIYPVPSKDNKLYVRLTSSVAGKTSTVELRNFIGKKLQSVKCGGKTDLEFNDMRQYPEGVYVILVKGKNGKIEKSEKFLIAR